MFRAGRLAVFALALLPSASIAQHGGMGGPPPEPWSVKVELGDAKNLTGTMRLASVELYCELGRYDVRLDKI